MQQDIVDSINKNLPLEVGNALQARLKELEGESEQLKVQLKINKELEASNSNRQDELNKANNEIIGLKAEMKANIDIVNNAIDVNHKIAYAGMKTEAAEDKCKMMNELVSKVFGHPSVRVTRSVDHPDFTDTNGNYQPGNTTFENTTTTQEKD